MAKIDNVFDKSSADEKNRTPFADCCIPGRSG